jgi:hypothetical protein
MDIMNNMTVSTSKLTFSLIAIAALVASGSAFMINDANAAIGVGPHGGVFDAPEFNATHLNTTATLITFDRPVNGTLVINDWAIMLNSTTYAGINGQKSQVTISNIQNSTATGIGQTAPSAQDKLQSSKGLGQGDNKQKGLGFLNGTTLVLIHAAIPSDATYFINYTNNPAVTNNATSAGGSGAFYGKGANNGSGNGQEGTATNKMLKIGSNATAADWMSPTVVSAQILKSNPQQVQIKMSENVANLNTTISSLTMTTSGGGNDAVPAKFLQTNGTHLYVTLQNPATPTDTYTIAYQTGNTGFNYWITDGINSGNYTQNAGASDGAKAGHGNRASNFTVSITNWLEIGMFGDVTSCYDCNAPIVTGVAVSLDSSIPIKVTNDNQVHINAGIGDTVSVMVTVNDNLGADTIPFAGLYTNFGATPDNLYYSNNFDSAKQMSTSYYEWNVRSDDVAFDNDGAITWNSATAKINSDRTQTFTYTMTINAEVESSQVWVDIGDKAGNYGKSALPITLEVSGAPGLTFASDDSQKVVSFFNESILLAIVSQWTTSSSDDASNVEQLSSVLGIENQLPTWTTNLASWVADDKIDVADMIVAVEYVINQ